MPTEWFGARDGRSGHLSRRVNPTAAIPISANLVEVFLAGPVLPSKNPSETQSKVSIGESFSAQTNLKTN